MNFKKLFLGGDDSKIWFIIKYFILLKVSYHVFGSLWGFITFLIITNQILSGIMLSFSLTNECMLISLSREEEDSENNYTDDFFWLHERGVDMVFIAVFFHLFKKLFWNINDLEQEYAWKSGVFAFLILQLTVFAGLVLCGTHLSEITLIIAANALHTFFLFKGKIYWWFFTDKLLNTDTIIRLAYLHYVIAFYLFYLGINHGIDMHYDWKSKNTFSGIKQQLSWWDEALSNEFSKFIDFVVILSCIAEILYSEPEALSYEIFMWGEIGIVTDVRFYGVAPHWYFRAFMAWLIACPYHYIGIFGLVFFFLIIYFQVSIHGTSELIQYKTSKSVLNIFYQLKNIVFQWKWLTFVLPVQFLHKHKNLNLNKNYSNWGVINPELSIQWLISYAFFIIAILYTLSFLPYGRFFNKIGGNSTLLIAYFYIFAFLTFNFIKTSWFLNNHRLNIIN